MRRIISFNKTTENCFYRGNKELFVSQDRYEGYKEALQKQGFLSMKNWFISHLVYVGRQFLSNDGEPS